MPIFDYSCHECNHQFEHLALPAAKEPLEIACPSCASLKVQKRLSAPAVHFKGSGFYSTDTAKGKNADKKAVPKAKEE
ncbi:transcriptional regulator [Candidatus Gracilibacteria bacterium CG17_big_fil_post_rev_8_21_14_2_50_48_13]|nr:MAG: transcriptional regulator [Candidatus Gracilibacteria bacterium CG17_big_fil_post_rev_8_21_14_2_50_48_13]